MTKQSKRLTEASDESGDKTKKITQGYDLKSVTFYTRDFSRKRKWDKSSRPSNWWCFIFDQG